MCASCDVTNLTSSNLRPTRVYPIAVPHAARPPTKCSPTLRACTRSCGRVHPCAPRVTNTPTMHCMYKGIIVGRSEKPTSLRPFVVRMRPRPPMKCKVDRRLALTALDVGGRLCPPAPVAVGGGSPKSPGAGPGGAGSPSVCGAANPIVNVGRPSSFRARRMVVSREHMARANSASVLYPKACTKTCLCVDRKTRMTASKGTMSASRARTHDSRASRNPMLSACFSARGMGFRTTASRYITRSHACISWGLLFALQHATVTVAPVCFRAVASGIMSESPDAMTKESMTGGGTRAMRCASKAMTMSAEFFPPRVNDTTCTHSTPILCISAACSWCRCVST